MPCRICQACFFFQAFLARVAHVAPEVSVANTITCIFWEVDWKHPLSTHVATQLLISLLASTAGLALRIEISCTRVLSAAHAHMT